ncbi:MAG TPA: hypothetical protein VF515_01950, partial [Candidatus Binatia bacterium]
KRTDPLNAEAQAALIGSEPMSLRSIRQRCRMLGTDATAVLRRWTQATVSSCLRRVLYAAWMGSVLISI